MIDQGVGAAVSDVDSLDFASGALSVSIYSGGQASEDVLSIRHEGSAPGQIGFNAGNITYGGVLIGTATGGASGADLVVALNSNANLAAASALSEISPMRIQIQALRCLAPGAYDFLSTTAMGRSASITTRR
ncbi:MAG: hypothetical protein IPG66_18360 [Hydrogenophilales bacterium]|nr:hypothetical protein [Hydrogenophilales bacterium]